MATYQELKSLQKDSDLQERVEVAVWIWSYGVITEADTTPNHAKRVTLAIRILDNPVGATTDLLPALLAANAEASASAIRGAPDAAVQSAVNTVLDVQAGDLLSAGTP